MAKYSTQNPPILLFFLVTLAAMGLVQGQTRLGFYSRTCPRVETIVRSTVQKHLLTNPGIAPGLLRMIFHDCFVQGCDASVLIDGPGTEKTSPANSRLNGFDMIDDAKAQLEAVCPGVVSCADILALASRDAVNLANGPTWQVPTGRLDGRISLVSETSSLPGPRATIQDQKQKFLDKGLNSQDLVTLVGGHTIGTVACGLFVHRLYNVNSTTGADPTISAEFLPILRGLCPQGGDGAKRVELDRNSGNRFDASFFTNLKNGNGVLETDQLLWTDASTRTIVQQFLGERGVRPLNFNAQFGRSMVKMTNIGVKKGAEGEIRKVCSAIN